MLELGKKEWLQGLIRFIIFSLDCTLEIGLTSKKTKLKKANFKMAVFFFFFLCVCFALMWAIGDDRGGQ